MWVIVDRLTKSAHFLLVRMTFTLKEFYLLYIREIVRLHGVPVSIVSDRDPRFMANFWKSFQRVIGTRLMMSTAFHPQTDGQSVTPRPGGPVDHRQPAENLCLIS